MIGQLPGNITNIFPDCNIGPILFFQVFMPLFIQLFIINSQRSFKSRFNIIGFFKLIKNFSDRISWIFGKGLIAAILFNKPGSNKPDCNFPSIVCEKAMQKGVYSIRTGCGTIKLGPPLTITEDALKEAINVYIECMHEMIIDNE